MYTSQFFASRLGRAALVSILAMLALNIYTFGVHGAPAPVAISARSVA